MKKNIFLQWIAIGIYVAVVLVSCTKDNAISYQAENNTSPKAPNFAGYYTEVQKYGSLIGTILPIEAAATIHLSGNASLELLLDSTGAIVPTHLPKGEYKIDIVPANYNYGYYTISHVFVQADSITNIGTITLEYYDGGSGGCEIGWGRLKNK
ncbi:MAG TPA: hypothetical protein VFU29_06535 [Chitinophagaceae bacterium]|nr:hypothetical protein [Chitinophagaceae bacterium]